ncbi:MAG: ABC transporter ATP-binding protein [Acidimicrobiia bacterium]|nr:ABC transporter ATP-binding protein [Acidimicrobiia bacterium]
MLELRDVRAGYGRIEVLHGLTLAVPTGTVVAVLGPNGAGKTTALRAVAGTLPVTGGSVRLDGARIDGRRPSVIARRGLALVPEGRGVFSGLTVEDNLRIAHRSVSSEDAGPWDAWVGHIAEVFPRLGERLHQQAGSLSGGEQQMLALCRVLVGQPKVVLVDELSMGLAPLVVEQLFEQVAALRATGQTIVLVEQYLTHALRYADLCYILAKGRVAWCGEPTELSASGAAASFLAG